MPSGDGIDKKVTIFEVDNSSSEHAHKTKNDILIRWKGPKDGLNYTTITVEAEYSISFREQQKKVP